MSKFHIKKDGTPGKCNATKGNCPLGGSDSHFDSAEEAQAGAQAKLEKQFGVTEKPSVDLTKTIPIDFVKDYQVDKDYYLKDGEDEDYFFGEVNMEILQLNMEEIDGLKEGEEYKVYCEVEYDEDEMEKLSSEDYSHLSDYNGGGPGPADIFVINSKYLYLINEEYRDHPNVTFSK